MGWRARLGWDVLGSVWFVGWVALGLIESRPVGFGWGGVDSEGLDRAGLVLRWARLGVGWAGFGRVDLGWGVQKSMRCERSLGYPDFDAW